MTREQCERMHAAAADIYRRNGGRFDIDGVHTRLRASEIMDAVERAIGAQPGRPDAGRDERRPHRRC